MPFKLGCPGLTVKKAASWPWCAHNGHARALFNHLYKVSEQEDLNNINIVYGYREHDVSSMIRLRDYNFIILYSSQSKLRLP